MAYHNRFVSVNLNKSYGQPSSSSPSPFPHGRSRAGGGMVVLSRSRTSMSSAAKTTPRLAVPPPLNLPSLRKEHERSDPSSSAAAAGRGGAGVGVGAGSSGMGWSKPAQPPPAPEKPAGGFDGQSNLRGSAVNSIAGNGAYLPPGSRSDGQLVASAGPAQGFSEKAVILRGEEFPSLRATVDLAVKQKDSTVQKQKLVLEEQLDPQADLSESRMPFQMRPQMKSSLVDSNSKEENSGGLSIMSSKQSEKFHSGPLPVVRLHHTSDWADDERDTALSLPERDRGRGYLRSESVQFTDVHDGREQFDTKIGIAPSRDFYKGNAFGRDAKTVNSDSRDFGSWRSPLQSRDRFNNRDFGANRDRPDVRPLSASREATREGNVDPASFGDSGRDGPVSTSQGIQYAKRALGSPMKPPNVRVANETLNGRFSEQSTHGRYGDSSNNWYKGSSLQSGTMSKGQFPVGTREGSMGGSFLKVGSESRSTSSVEKPYLEDSGFDNNDPFSGGVRDVKMFKRKKDTVKQADLYDPVRASFEAELENILRVQEQERQKVMEEQARAMEYARKEEEERQRFAREEDERRRLIEEEARNSAWRAELEKLEASRRAEEQRLAREEEKRRYQLEDERRKEAAKQKLLELEAKIVKRQTEDKVNDDRFTSSSTVSNDRTTVLTKERVISRTTEVRDWEENERMVERVTGSASSDPSSLNKYFEGGNKPQSSRDGDISSVDRGKSPCYSSTLQEQDTALRSPQQDTFSSRRVYPKKDLYGNLGTVSSRPSVKGRTIESSTVPDDYHQVRQHGWNTVSDNDHVKRNKDADTNFLDNDRFDEVGWARRSSHGSPLAQFAERSFQNSEIEDSSSFTRYRQFLRQPHVPPPPSMTSGQRSSFRASSGRESSSSFIDERTHYNHPSRNELRNPQMGYDNTSREAVVQLETTPLQAETIYSESNVGKLATRCDSPSSVSVSSPPSSPVPLSHDEMDVAGDSPALPTSADGERTALSDNEHASTMGGGVLDRITSPRSISHTDDEWGVGSKEDIQDEEDYDEEDDDYRDIEETHGEYYNLDLDQEVEDLHSDMQAASGVMEQVILGFDEGVEVKIPSNSEMEITCNQRDNELKAHAVSTSVMDNLVDSSSTIVSETEKAMQGLSLDAVTKASCPVISAEEHMDSGMLVQHAAGCSSSLQLASASSVPSIISSSSPASQSEVPVKLQFGLFSGPTLIPPPVPAIQIGSIQTPIPVHAQINPSLPQIDHSRAPLFQFGQLRYPASLPQNILHLATQNLPFIRPQSPAPYSFNMNPAGSLHNQSGQDHISNNNSRNGGYSLSDKQQGVVPDRPDPSQEKMNYKQLTSLLDTVKDSRVVSQNQMDRLSFSQNIKAADSVSQSEHNANYSLAAKRSYRLVSGKKDSQASGPTEPHSYRFFNGGKIPSKTSGGQSSISGKRYDYITGSKPFLPESQTSHTDANNIQQKARRLRRTEFRVREYVEKRTVEGTHPVDNSVHDEKQNIDDRNVGKSSRNASKKGGSVNRSTKMTAEPDNSSLGDSVSQVPRYEGRVEKNTEKNSTSRNSKLFDRSHAAEESMKLSGNSEEDVDAPLQSGVVRVFKQSGIEVPNDEDDFIEVRYKRRMLNDRREQRERENKIKSRINKAPRKQRGVSPINASASISQKQVGRLGGNSTKGFNSISSIAQGHVLGKLEQPLAFTDNVISQSMSSPGPASTIGDTGASSDKRLRQLRQTSVVSDSGEKSVKGLFFDNNNVTAESAVLGVNSWDKRNTDQEMMTLTQTQLDGATRTSQFDSHVTSNVAFENSKSISSALPQEKSLAPSTSPICSLLAGEKIKFGAVTSPTVLPPLLNRNNSNGLGAPGSSRSDAKIGQTLALTNNDCTLFFGKDKHIGDPCANLEDSEAEAEAAASAVAVAAISNDESVCTNRTEPTVSSSADVKILRNINTGSTSEGVPISLDINGQPASEEPLTVALPADLSVDTPSLSLWPSLPSPQASGPMLSHFPGAPPSPFPCFEVNPILGGRIFAYGPPDESAGTQEQSQRSLGIWPQCHSGVDSFYGPPAGFSGTFIGPGGIPGVQGPPHMVVYNHLAPVGQFGQLGLSFMGTTYIPTSKQTEWKQNQANEIEGDKCSANAVSGQTTSPSMPTASVQHLGPGSIMPMPSPLTMFDVTPFQPSADASLQGRWSHVPAPPLHPVPLSLPLQQQHHMEGATPPQLNHNVAVGTSSGNNRFNEHRPSLLADASRNIQGANSASSQLSDQLGVVHQSTSTSAAIQTIMSTHASGSGNSRTPRASRTSGANDGGGIGTSSNSSMNQSIYSSSRPHQANSQSQRYFNSIGFADQLGGTSQKISSNSEWHRRAGFQGRNQSSGGDKNFGHSKLKQIYVAKPASGGHSSSQG